MLMVSAEELGMEKMFRLAQKKHILQHFFVRKDIKKRPTATQV